MPDGPVVRLFGPVRITQDQTTFSAGAPRQAGLLSVLALNVGRSVSMDAAIGGLWGEDPPRSATNAVQVAVSALRKTLLPTTLRIETAGRSYTLAASLDDIDTELFQRLAAEGHSALRGFDPARAMRQLDRAWELWHPDPFAGLTDYAFVGSARAALAALGQAVATDRGIALCALSRADEAVVIAGQLVADHPFHEPAWDLLMRSLYYCGRQHESLSAFSRVRTLFVDELGLDPSPELGALQRQILDRSLELPVAVTATVVLSEDTPAVTNGRLPELPNEVIGRDAEIDRILQLVQEGKVRLITLVGLGGIGKTTAALAAGHRLAAAGVTVVFADLAAATSPAVAFERLCTSASVGAGAEAAASLADADPQLLIIADNAEQIDGFPTAVAALIAHTRRLQLLVTSRVPLRIRAETLVAVEPLQTRGGAALQLFEDRVRSVRADLDLAAHRQVSAEICDYAGGIPLGIEVAARRLRHLTPLDLIERLRRHAVELLDGPAPADQPVRQQSLRTVLDATGSLLSIDAIEVARRLAVLKGPVSLGVVERLLADRHELSGRIDELVDASLVNGPDASGHYRMPLPVAEYFLRADEAPDQQRILTVVLDLLGPLTMQADGKGRWAEVALLGDSAAVTVACVASVRSNDIDRMVQLCIALRRYWLLGGWMNEAIDFCSTVGELASTHARRAEVRLVLGQFAAMVNRTAAGDLLMKAIDEAEGNPAVDEQTLLNSWCYLGEWRFYRGDMSGAREAAARVNDMGRSSTDASVAALSRDFLAYFAEMVGDLLTAAQLGSRALAEARRQNDLYVVVDLLHRNARVELMLGHVDRAEALVGEAMDMAATISVGPLAASVLATRAAVDIELGRLSAAIGAGVEALRLTTMVFPSYPAHVVQGEVLRLLSLSWSIAGDVETAAGCAGAAAKLLERVDAPATAAFLLSIEERLGDLVDASQDVAARRSASLDPTAWIRLLIERSDR